MRRVLSANDARCITNDFHRDPDPATTPDVGLIFTLIHQRAREGATSVTLHTTRQHAESLGTEFRRHGYRCGYLMYPNQEHVKFGIFWDEHDYKEFLSAPIRVSIGDSFDA
jgi:hypothetical protein